MFVHVATVRLHDTDAAGVMYFAHQFRLAHEAYETFMEQSGCGLGALLQKGKIALPIVKAEADYREPLRVGDEVTLTLRLLRMGRSSFTLVCRLSKNGATAGHVTTTHVAVDPATRRALPIPPSLKKILLTLRG